MDVQLKLEKKKGRFFINKDDAQIAELDFILEANVMDAYHTGVRKEFEGQGIAGILFDEMIKYARDNSYKVIPTCPYILAKFRRHPDDFAEIWVKDEE
ncbi:MAG: GNAT family N-acetyltransferase [Dysgonamonadaceae bacterium]